jgi:hypothetical protein
VLSDDRFARNAAKVGEWFENFPVERRFRSFVASVLG